VPERYGQFATSLLHGSRLLVVRKVSDALWSCWGIAFIGVENAFRFRSGVEARAAHSDEGRNEVKTGMEPA